MPTGSGRRPFRLGSAPLGSAPLGPALLVVWLLALVAALVGLGNLPLRDWDEGIVARVALETGLAPWPQNLLPTFWGNTYLNKPPGLHLLIGAAIGLWRRIAQAPQAALPPEWVVRLVPALLSTTVVPLLALVQWRLRPGDKTSALATALIALTLMPLARSGRLAMLDGGQLVAMVALWWALLGVGPARRGALAGGLLAGLAGSALLLLKAPLAFPLLLASLGLRGLEGGLPLAVWRRLLLGVALGLLPGLAWHGVHLAARGPEALAMWTSQGFARVGQSIEGHGGGPLLPLLKVLEGGWPWLPLWPFGLALAWKERRRRAGFWCLALTLITAALVLPLRTQLPWYSLLLWPPFCLVCGPVLAWLPGRGAGQIAPALVGAPPGARVLKRVPLFWALLGALVLLAAVLAAAGLVPLPAATRPLALVLGAGLLAGGVLLARPGGHRGPVGVLVLAGGVWAALLVLLAGPLWLWELQEQWSVLPVAAVLRQAPAGLPAAALWQEPERPSLNWYAGRRVPVAVDPPTAPDLLLLSRRAPQLPAYRCRLLEPAGELGLYRCERAPDG